MNDFFKYVFVAVLLVVCGYFIGRLHTPGGNGAIVDTVYVSQPAVPDTVMIDSIIYRDVVKRVPVYVDCLRTITKIETLLTTVADTVYLSKKTWRYAYAENTVSAWANAPVDSFRSDLKIDWQNYHKSKINPLLHAENNKGFKKGIVYGLSGMIGILAILKL